MRVVVIGSQGFVGSHLIPTIRKVCGDDVEIIATARVSTAEYTAEELDISDNRAVRAFLSRTEPTHIVNLAGIASPNTASAHPDQAWEVHCEAVRHLGRAMLEIVPTSVLLNVGTGLVYGASFASGIALDESALLQPIDEYAASKAAGDLALSVLARQGLRCILMRPFNHIGPGQTRAFVVPAFAAQVAAIEAGGAEPVLRVGDLTAERDFIDVRDVCDAYARALLVSDRLSPGTIINIASGNPRKIRDVLSILLSMSNAAIRVEQEPERVRRNDVSRVVGDASRAHALLNWTPKVSFEDTLNDVLREWRLNAVVD